MTDRVESVALDEAYLDVTENKLHLADPVRLRLYFKSKFIKRLD
jgi:DNA polymerase-4